MKTLKAFIQDEDGAALVEYGLLIALIAAIAIVAVKSIGQKVSKGFSDVDAALPALPQG
jgi:pilus assembly protein Flp/PilA